MAVEHLSGAAFFILRSLAVVLAVELVGAGVPVISVRIGPRPSSLIRHNCTRQRCSRRHMNLSDIIKHARKTLGESKPWLFVMSPQQGMSSNGAEEFVHQSLQSVLQKIDNIPRHPDVEIVEELEPRLVHLEMFDEWRIPSSRMRTRNLAFSTC